MAFCCRNRPRTRRRPRPRIFCGARLQNVIKPPAYLFPTVCLVYRRSSMAEPGVGYRNRQSCFINQRLNRCLPNTLQFKPMCRERETPNRFATSNSRLGHATLTVQRAISKWQNVPAACRALEPRPTKDSRTMRVVADLLAPFRRIRSLREYLCVISF